MDELMNIHNVLNQLINNWDNIIDKFIRDFEPFFVDIVQEQLSKGKGGNGGDLDTYASDEYTRFKKNIGSISAPIADLKLSGDFYEGMTMNDDLEIFSTDWKDELLHRQYGDDITEVSTDNLNKLIIEEILPAFEAFIKEQLRL